MIAPPGLRRRIAVRIQVICFIAASLGILSSAANAADVNVGTITLNSYSRVGPAGGAGGVNAIATANVNLAGTCLAGATLHWMQIATLSTPFGPVLPPGFVGPPQPNLGVPGFSNIPTSIDPIPGQPIGQMQTGNATPFYDITVNKVADFADQTKWLREGTGTIWGDRPMVPFNLLNAGNTPFTVTFQTILVATTAANPKTLLELGGFQWGFTDTIKPNNVTLMNPTALTWANINAAAWQSSLDAWFGPAGNYTLAQATCPKGNPVVRFVPEPSTIVMATLGVPVVVGAAARSRRRRAA